MQSWVETFGGLDRDDLRKVAAAYRVDLEDIEQEARLMSYEIASGRSKYDPAFGPARAWIMSTLWGRIRKSHNAASRDAMRFASNHEDAQQAAESQPDPVGSALDNIVAREALRAADALLEARRDLLRKIFDPAQPDEATIKRYGAALFRNPRKVGASVGG
ncbi:uncharacterized protein E1O_19950 [Burkholderiales bacterium GJ-E10]|nr:uncharacterized protein E1O_19950 [Burkholderiales bacterium GJ-E10]